MTDTRVIQAAFGGDLGAFHLFTARDFGFTQHLHTGNFQLFQHFFALQLLGVNLLFCNDLLGVHHLGFGHQCGLYGLVCLDLRRIQHPVTGNLKIADLLIARDLLCCGFRFCLDPLVINKAPRGDLRSLNRFVFFDLPCAHIAIPGNFGGTNAGFFVDFCDFHHFLRTDSGHIHSPIARDLAFAHILFIGYALSGQLLLFGDAFGLHGFLLGRFGETDGLFARKVAFFGAFLTLNPLNCRPCFCRDTGLVHGFARCNLDLIQCLIPGNFARTKTFLLRNTFLFNNFR